MPEGDTVWRTARHLDEALAGRDLTRCDIRVPQLATVDLTGETVENVASRGKHLLVRVGAHTLHSHLGMDGSWHLYGPTTRWKRPAHQARVVLGTLDRVAVGFLLHRLDVVPRSAEEQLVAHLGPDLLGADWDAQEAVRRLRSDPERPIGEALLDQRNLAGVGNVYRSEVCFVRGVHPGSPTGSVSHLSRLVDQVRRMLQVNQERVRRCTTGDLRRGHELWVYGRQGQPCRRCGTPVRSSDTTVGAAPARVFYWCPGCQPEGRYV
ncbi:MAG: DNA-formamidopyrimidine glycosylase family protein [Nocardioidaceae bacterium]